ncbi:unnamed protein product [Prorocentrum cordatum]|uniref:Uncharacterized protein n=1 Tax=Prorocentrum cordatum TaxID=2364126 RepID=A0ABN9UXG0_9DINO|nr:unnamed protein product [Polarella glacialis]
MKTGIHVLINIPRGISAENAFLRVQAEARRFGGSCADMYFQALNVTGLWAEAKQAGGYHFDSHSGVNENSGWFALGSVEVKVAHGRTQGGTLYLNFYVKHLRKAGFPVGGLLGEDDHQDATTQPAECEELVALSPAFQHASTSARSIATANLA